MMFKKFVATTAVLLPACLVWALFIGYASAQSDDESSTYSGVMIDAQGMLKRNSRLDAGNLSRQWLDASRASYSHLSQNVMQKTPIRYISLNRLEKAIVDAGGTVSDEMKYLAGIQRIRYVFYFPETKDIVVAGPAEGWFPGFEGAMIGRSSGRPVCELQDLVVALRAYAPGSAGAPVVGCSIDPTEEGNVRLQQFIGNFGRHDGPGRQDAFVEGLRKSLGKQSIRVDGIPASTHAAVVMVAADYRMKRIGIGVEQAPVNMTTFISKVNPAKQSRNALFRWFFVPDYQSVIVTRDRNGLELTGEGVKLVAEDEVVTATGERVVKSGKIDPASKAFSRSFTEKYPELARKSLVFAQLRNFVDMLVCAAHIHKEDFYGKSGWTMEFLGDESQFAVQTVSAPTQVDPVVGQRQRGGIFMAPIGGVQIEADRALTDANVRVEEKDRVSDVRNKVKIELQAGQWWWD